MPPAANALSQVRVGATVVNYRTEPSCKVCSSPYRLDVETKLAQGQTPWSIEQALPDAGLTKRNVADHWRHDHIGAQTLAVRQVAHAHAEAVAKPAAALTEATAGHLGFAHSVMDRVAERMKAGQVEPEVRDAIAAARLIQQVEAAAVQQSGIEDYVDAMVAMSEIIRDMLSYEDFLLFGGRLAAHPVLRDLQAREAQRDAEAPGR